MDDKLQEQTRAEKQMLIDGAEAYYRNTNEAQNSGRGEDTSYARSAISQLLEPVANRITTDIEDASKQGQPPLAHKVLSHVGCDTAAAIGLRTLFNALTRKSHNSNDVARTSAASEIGRAVQLELKTRALLKEDKAYTEKVIQQWNRRGSADVGYRMRVINRLLKLKEVKWNEWTPQVRIHVGASILHAILESTDLFELVTIKKNRKNLGVVRLTQQAVKWIDKHQDFMALLHPQYRPMIVPPRDWSVDSKPYLTDLVNETIKFVRTRYSKTKVKPEDIPVEMYRAVSIIQSTPWRIDGRVLAFAQELLRMQHTTLIPEPGNEQPPEFEYRNVPKDDMSEAQQEALKEWKLAARMIHNKNVSVRSNRIRFNQTLKLAEEYLAETVYFPHNVDSRGRVYPIPTILNPQGDDLAKGLLRFARGYVLTDSGVRHLRLQIANKFGLDKASQQTRLAWVADNEDLLYRIASNPLDHVDFLEEVDSPFQFLSACMYYKDWKDDPTALNYARVNKDGSCNGLQHFAAMTLDADMGKSVNLVDAEDSSKEPESIYKVVAAEVDKLLAESTEPMSYKWKAYWDKYNDGVVDYKAMKRPVMTLPYSATAYSRMEYIREYMVDHKAQDFFRDSFNEATSFLVQLVTQAMNNRIAGAMRVLDWLRDSGKSYLADNDVLKWTTPYGFPVRTYKPDMKGCTVVVHYLGKRIKYRLRLPVDSTNTQQCLYAVAPNYVHSMDAQHLLMVCNELRRKVPVHVVHDDIGCPVNYGDYLVETIKQQFVELYKDDPVKKLAEELGIEDHLNKVDTLNIEDVNKSVYFFD